MTVEEIDNFKGPLKDLLPKLDEFINVARARKDHESCVALCAATRSAFMRVHLECSLFPDTSPEKVDWFVVSLRTALHHLGGLMNEVQLDPPERDHLEGMVSNITFRIEMLEALKAKTPIEERLAHADSIALNMTERQRELRETQNRGR